MRASVTLGAAAIALVSLAACTVNTSPPVMAPAPAATPVVVQPAPPPPPPPGTVVVQPRTY